MRNFIAALLFCLPVWGQGSVKFQTTTRPEAGAVARSQQDRNNETISVKDFGAKCDGTTNDTTAFAAAVAAAAVAGNPVIHVPAGICVTNVVLGNDQSIEGAGSSSPDFDFTDYTGTGAPTVLQDASGGTQPVVLVTSGTFYSGVRNMLLLGTGSGSADRGVYIANGTNDRIENVTCNNFGEECVRWEAGAALRIRDLLASNTLLNRTRSTWSGALYIGGTDALVSAFEVGTSIGTGHLGEAAHSISSNCYNTGITVAGANNFFSDGNAETSEYGWYISGENNRFTGIRADLNFCSGMYVAEGGNQVSNSTFLRNARDGDNTWTAVYVQNNANVFSGNEVEQVSGTTQGCGFTDVTAGDTVYNSYLGNRMGNNITDLYCFPGVSGAAFILPDKDAVEITAGTTAPDVRNFILYYFAQTSPLSINTMTGTSGQRACFKGNVNITFTTGGNIVPPYNEGQLLVANEVYCYRNAEGTWYAENLSPQFQRLRTEASGVFTELRMRADGAPTNDKEWTFQTNNGIGYNQFLGTTYDDAETTATPWILVDRTGTTVNFVRFPNGGLEPNATIRFNGTVTYADLVPWASAGLQACSDCQATSSTNAVCTSGGTGALAIRVASGSTYTFFCIDATNGFAGSANLPNIVTAATNTKITYNAKGLVTAGAKTDISSSADVTGVLLAAGMPALTGDVTTVAGALASTLKNTGTSGTYTKVTTDAQGRVTAGGSLAAADITGYGAGNYTGSGSGDVLTLLVDGSTPGAGMYRVSAYLANTATGTGNYTISVAYTDVEGVACGFSLASMGSSGLSGVGGDTVIATNGTDVKISVTISSGSMPAYTLLATLEQLL